MNAIAKSRYKLLIVDHEQLIVDTFTLEEIFTAHNYEVRSVRTAEQALKTISHWLPDLAIIDKMNGVDLAVLLTRQFQGCGRLLFSNQRLTTNLLAEPEGRGCSFAVLSKPIDMIVLLETVYSLLVQQQLKQLHEAEMWNTSTAVNLTPQVVARP